MNTHQSTSLNQSKDQRLQFMNIAGRNFAMRIAPMLIAISVGLAPTESQLEATYELKKRRPSP